MGKKERIRTERDRKTKKNRLIIILAVVAAVVAVSINFAQSGGGDQEVAQSNIPNNSGGSEQEIVQNKTPSNTPTDSSNNLPPSGPIKATWIEPQVNSTSVSIQVSEVEDNWNTHFKLETEEGIFNFMAYILDEVIYVRANVCPPCKSIGYSLLGDILVCDRCATTFEAKTGDGIGGACVDYPKALVSYEIINGNILMNETDLIAAYQDTLMPGWP